MSDAATLLAAYDDQLRTDAETPGADTVVRYGPLHWVTFAGGRGFVTYRDLGGVDAVGVEALVAATLDHYRADPSIRTVEWKSRGHDHAPGLADALPRHGFEPEETESVMIGETAALAVDVPLPAGVGLRRVDAEPEVRAMVSMQNEVFGDPDDGRMAAALLHRLGLADGMELWIAEADGVIVSAGRLEPVTGTRFAGVWGGATRPEWRGRGIYRALTAARARSALRGGKTLMHSDSTEFSRPILERAGLVRVTTTTPYVWKR